MRSPIVNAVAGGSLARLTVMKRNLSQRERAAQQQHQTENRDRNYYATGEDRLKARARELFRQGHYDEVAQIESRFPELLTASERTMFTLARKRR